MDPFAISPAERIRFEQQFTSLQPINGIVTGDQAKGFFLQSQLPPAILGVIWGLADTDADGRMNINEFSIACKLINLKLRGFELPKALPPSLQALAVTPVGTPLIPGNIQAKPPIPPLPQAVPAQPSLIGGIGGAPTAPYAGPPPRPAPATQVPPINRVISPPSGGGSPIISPPPQITPPVAVAPTVPSTIAPPIPVLSSFTQPPLLPSAPMIPPQPILPPQPVLPQQPIMPPVMAAPVVPIQPAMPGQPVITQPVLTQPLIGAPPGAAVIPPILPPSAAIPPNTLTGLTQAQPAQPVPVAPILDRVGSMESPLANTSPLVEWAVPQASKLKYTQLFNTTDKSRTGYLSGVQARNILLASQLPQQILAQIWGLSDMDADGRLSCEEFVLALHLCDMARSGETIPPTLPPNLVPPTLRRQRNNSLTAEQGDPLAGISSVTFEDKRKENFEKGQAELDRRRKALLEIQRKEQEERDRKEREERDKQEKIRLEQEKKRQEEFERQLERQRELEKAKEEERKRAQEQKEAARREMERQRQVEWENQRSQELQSQRQKQQEQLLSAKAKNQSLTIELSQLTEKVKDLSRQISETRCGVTGVKSTIDGMRATRDEQMADLNRLKGVLKQQNQRLVTLSQQKTKLEAQGKLGKDAASEEQARLAFNNKQITIKHLKEKIDDLEEQVKNKSQDLENNNSQLDTLREELTGIVTECEEIYPSYDEKRNIVYEKKGIRTNTSADAWGDSAWDSAPSWNDDTEEVEGYKKYRALYEFSSRNSDELSFQPGDIILVPTTQNAEPGWLSGELRGASGWFPESYVEPVGGAFDNNVAVNVQPKTPLEGIAEVAENLSENDFGVEEGPVLPIGSDPILGLGMPVDMTATARYSFNAKKGTQISFLKGDVFAVSEIQDQWCYGHVNGQDGWLPKSYVALDETNFKPTSVQDVTMAPSEPVGRQELPPEEQEYYVAMYPYQSEEPGDLMFDQGESILVVAKDNDWWTGVIGGRTGIFPSNYVQKPEVTAAETPPAPAIVQEPPAPEPEASPPAKIEPQVQPSMFQFTGEETAAAKTSGIPSHQGSIKVKKPEIATVMAPYQATSDEQLSLQRGQLIMIRKKTSTGWWEGELQAKGKKRQIGWFPASYVKLLGGMGGSKTPEPTAKTSGSVTPTPADSSAEKVIALYQYVAQNEDELNFDKDDIITVISKDEPSWWKGELNGASGLFPSNYVGPLSNSTSITTTNHKQKIRISKLEKKRQEAIKELILTEQSYINDMTMIHEVFEKPLIESRVIPQDKIRAIFINYREIIECNYSFLRALRVRREMSEHGLIRMIGDILCENLPRMNVYARFCSCQLKAPALLQALTEDNKDFRSLSKRCQSDPRTQGLPLSSFLIKPMQRVTKYPLLVSKILQCTPEDHPDRKYLEEALTKAEEVCAQINEGVREKENSERLEWLQTNVLLEGLPEPLIFNSLTNSAGPRKLMHHGVLCKTKSGKELVGFLMNDFLLLAQPNRPLGHQFSFERHHTILLKVYKQPLLLSETQISNHIDGNDGVDFRLESNLVIFNLTAGTTNERNLWIKKLNLVQKELREQEEAKRQKLQTKRATYGACGRVLVVVQEGMELKQPATLKPQYFCELSMGLQEHRTEAVSAQQQDPKWNSTMQFLIRDLNEDVLCITVKDKGFYSPDEFLGRTELRVSEILQATQSTPGPVVKAVKLHEVRTGRVVLKLDLQLFG